MKKTMRSLLAVLLAVSFVNGSVFAKVDQSSIQSVQKMQNEIAQGHKKMLTVERLAHSDVKWKDSLYGSGNTIGSSGAALTSVTMVYNFYYPENKVTPVEMDELIKGLSVSGNYQANCNMPWDLLAPIGLKLDHFCDLNDDWDMFSHVMSAINHSSLPILHLTNDNKNHYVVAVGYEDTSVVYLADPGGYNRKTLNEAIEAGWKVEDVIVLVKE